MTSSNKNIAERVRTLIEPTVKSLGYSIWDCEYLKEGAEWYLRVTIDSEKGIDLNAVEEVHRAIEPIIDKEDPIETSYYLDVSSPGIERNLRTTEHFRAVIGQTVELKLFTALEGVKHIKGILAAVSESGDEVFVTSGSKEYKVGKNIISKANVSYDFDAELSAQSKDNADNEEIK